MKPWVRNVGFLIAGAALCLVVGAVLIGIVFTVQHVSLEPEEKALTQGLHPRAGSSGRVVLSLSSAAVTVRAGPAGGPIRVTSDFDPGVFRLEHAYEENDEGGWTYRVDFHERTNLHVSVVRIWLGKRSPEVVVELPRDLPLSLEAKMEGGYLELDLAGLALTETDLELERGVLGVVVSEPLAVPLERMSLKGRVGTMILRSLGNASPRKLTVRHGFGAALFDLDGDWRADADVDLQVSFANGDLSLPLDVSVEGLGPDDRRGRGASEREFPPPTLRFTTRSDVGEIRIVD